MSSIDKTGVNQWLRLVDRASDADTADAGFGHFYIKNGSLYFIDDAGTVTGPLASTSGGTGEIFLSAAGGWPSTTNGCAANTKVETTTNKQNQYVLDFDPSAIEYAEWTVWMPDNWDGGDLTWMMWWEPGSGASASEVALCALQCRSYGDDDAVDQAWGSAVEISDTVIAVGKNHFSGESASMTPAGTPAAGEAVQFRFYRNATSVSDTMNSADLRLKGIKVFYTKS